jgi:thiol:disulfide interchange protein DsbD
VVALSIFAALGLGLALPYLFLSFAPWMRRALPRPGAWMDTLKQLFAFPIYASAAWLLWVLAQQTSSIGLGAALAGAILVALAAWAYQKSKSSSSGGRVAALVTAALAVLLAIALPARFAGVPVAGAAAAGAGTASGGEWQPYDAARVASLNAAAKPLLVNFTASWCLTCLVNERNAFADSAVQEVFRDRGVTLMKGDWTNRDPAITQALAAFGRAGVPLYVVYNATPGSSAPVVLPQLLTPGVVQSAFAATPRRNVTP